MKADDISIRILYTFCTVVNAGGFHAAARILNISEPTVSYQIRSLEQALDTTLIIRGRKIELTEAGKVLLPFAQHTTEMYHSVRSRVKRLRTSMAGEISIALASAEVKRLIPTLCSEFYKAHPDVEISIRHDSADSITESMLRQKVDIGFISQDYFHHSELRAEVIARKEVIVVCGRSHPLAKRRQIPPAELLQYGFVIPVDQETYINRNKLTLVAKHFEIEKIEIVIENFDIAKQYVAEQGGLLLCSEYAVQKELHMGSLQQVDLIGEPYYRNVYMLICKGKIITPVQKIFMQDIRRRL